jgi:hypothetical protein
VPSDPRADIRKEREAPPSRPVVIDPANTETSRASGSDTRTQPARCHGVSDVSRHIRAIKSMRSYHHLTFLNASAQMEAGEASFAES